MIKSAKIRKVVLRRAAWPTILLVGMLAFFAILRSGLSWVEPQDISREQQHPKGVGTTAAWGALKTATVSGSNSPALVRMVELPGGQLDFAGAGITIPKDALKVATAIRIERLPDTEVPPLDPGMTNVTAGGGGYRFLPHGTNFGKEVTIQIPVDGARTDSKTDNISGVHTYFWDETYHLWVPLKRVRVDIAEKQVISRTTHFTTMINATLTPPDHPPPLQFNPNSIKDIAAADPAAGIDLIGPPSANNRGTAQLSYPIRLPRGRGAFSPQLTLAYSSSRSNGWLGVGWDLDIQRIEIDTRWGVPAYEPGGSAERVRFLLNGTAIVPIDRDPRTSCKATANATVDKQFARRNDTFQRIVRCKIGTAVHWEVTAKDGVRFEYGTDDESRLTSYQAGESSNTAVWFLRRVVDPNENATEYRYLTDPTDPGLAIPGFQGEPFVQKYLKEIVYTSHPNQQAAYKVDLLSDCTSRQDLLVSGRTGFKVLTRCRLSQIDVKFQDELIRRYLLDYIEGAFGKSVLSQLRVRGADGSAFYEHRFEYTKPEFQEAGGNSFADAVAWPATPSGSAIDPIAKNESGISRTSETDHSIEARAGIGFSVGLGSGEAGCIVGVNAGLNFGHPQPEVQHLEANGDSVEDRIWKSDSGIKALRGQSVANAGSFIGPSPTTLFSVNGIGQLGSQDEIGGLLGVDGRCGGGGASAGVGLSFSVRKSDSNSLLADADGDGLADLALGGSIISGLPHTCRDGNLPDPVTGTCSDGLSACSDPNALCFRQEPSLASLAPEGSRLGQSATQPQDSTPSRLADNSRPPANRATKTSPPSPAALVGGAGLSGSSPLQPDPPTNRNTALSKRLQRDPLLRKEMYRLDPVIRWDAWHTGTIQLKARARRKHLGGSDGVTVHLLRVANPLSPNGTLQLNQVRLAPDSKDWQELAGGGTFDVQFEDSFMVVVDTVDDVPVDANGNLLDEIELQFHVEYLKVCPPDQPCRPLESAELQHRDATGQLAYVFDFPGDLRISELPRDRYWQLLPPISQALRSRPHLILEHNRISGVIRKRARTETPVHVRIRCESFESRKANDGTVCPMGTILAEKVFGPDEVTAQEGVPLEIEQLPFPFLLDVPGAGHFRYAPVRLLFEVDGENGKEIPPEALDWNPVIEIVSINDVEEGQWNQKRYLFWLGQISFIDFQQPWLERPRVLYRVHPARQLVPFRTGQDNQELNVTVNVVNLRKDLIVSVTSDSTEGELGRLTIPAKTATGAVQTNDQLEVTQEGENIAGDTLVAYYGTHVVTAALGRPPDPNSTGGDDQVQFTNPTTAQLKNQFNVGENVAVIVTDPGANRDPNVAERIKVRFETVNSGDVESLVLVERGADTGVFVTLFGLPTTAAAPIPVTERFTVKLPKAGLYYVRGYVEAGFNITTSIALDAKLGDVSVPTNLLTAKFGGTKFFPDAREPLPTLVGEVPYTFEPFGGGHHGFFYGQFNGEDKFECIGPRPCTKPHPGHSGPVILAECSERDSDCDGLENVKDDCPFTPGDFAHKGCPDPNQPPPPSPCAGQPVDLGADGCLGGLIRRFGPMDGNIVGGISCFTGSDPIARTCADGTHPTRNGSVPRGSDGTTDGEEKDGKDIRRSWTFGISAYADANVSANSFVGVGVSGNLGVGMTWTDLEFMDFNGDGVPDTVGPDFVSLTGLNRNFSVDSAGALFDAVRDTLNVTAGVTVGGGATGAFVHKTSPGGRAKAQGFASLNFNRHAQYGQSSTVTERIDVNGDGLPDLVYGEVVCATCNTLKMMVRLNLGNRLGEKEDWGEIDIGTGAISRGTLAENLDSGLLGLLAQQRSLHKTRNLTTGLGIGGSVPIELLLVEAELSGGKSDDATLAQSPVSFADIDGDGLPDIVFKSQGESVVHVRLNRGGVLAPPGPGCPAGGTLLQQCGFRTEELLTVPGGSQAWNPMPRFPEARAIAGWIDTAITESPDTMDVSGSATTTFGGTVRVKVFFGLFGDYSFSYRYTGGRSGMQLGFYDADGDGLPDRVLRSGGEGSAAIQVQRNRLDKANLLKIVHRPLGGRIVLSYDKQSKPSEDDPKARWLLTSYSLEPESSFPPAFRTASLSETFDYSEPYYDRFEREFYGFKQVDSTRAGDGRVVKTEYFNRDYLLQRLVRKTQVLGPDPSRPDQLKLFNETVNEKADGTSGFEPERTHGPQQACTDSLTLPLVRIRNAPQGAPCESWFVKPSSIITRWFEGGSTPKRTVQRFEQYDEFGNVTQIIDEQDEGPTDDLTATVEHDRQEALLDAHIVDRVTRVSAQGADGTQLRLRRGSYDTLGNLRRHEVFANPAGTKIATLDFQYDPLGFTTAVTDSTGYQVDYEPDDAIHLLAKKITDSFGLVSTASYDFKFQLSTEVVDANGQRQTRMYDPFGRLISVARPYELAAGLQSLEIAYSIPTVPLLPVGALTSNRAVVPGAGPSSQLELRTARFVDALRRTIQSRMDAEVNGSIGQVVSGKVEYDGAGQLVTQGQPIFVETVSPIPNPLLMVNVPLIQPTRWEYDPLDRTTKTSEPGDRITRATYDISVHPRLADLPSMRMTVIDPDQKIREEHRDAAGRLVAVVQKLDGQRLVTAYGYKPTGELVSIKDALDRETRLEYDLGGQRTAVTTPDTGRLELVYDANGNLTEKIDPVLRSNGQRIIYGYNKNRLASVSYPQTPSVTFSYGDDPNVCPGQSLTKGRICKITDASGTELMSYGALGEVTKSIHTMRGAAWERDERAFATRFVYDSFGRLRTLTYPDEETLTYDYDRGGRVKKVTGRKSGSVDFDYVRNILYDEFGQRTRVEYGNGVTTRDSYEPDTRRLHEAVIAKPDGTALQELRYGYDHVGNILNVTDTRGAAPLFLRGATRTYTYDDLHQVKTLSLQAEELGVANWSISAAYDYDNVGNLTAQRVSRARGGVSLTAYPSRDWTYTYGSTARPNLPDTIGPYNFTYDARGSILRSERLDPTAPLGTTYVWDEEGRLLTSQLQGLSQVTEYTYNAKGRRARKQSPRVPDGPDAPSDTSVYPNEYYTARFARMAAGGCASQPCWEAEVSRSKHIYVDGQRVAVTALIVPESQQTKPEEQIDFALSVRQFFHSDPVGSAALLTNQSGERTQELDYFPFGEELFDKRALEDQNLPQAYRFDGKELDPETGLQYFGARYYDPRIARWSSADPLVRLTPEVGLAQPQQVNLFAFSLNNALRYVDSTGLGWECSAEEEGGYGCVNSDTGATAIWNAERQAYDIFGAVNYTIKPPSIWDKIDTGLFYAAAGAVVLPYIAAGVVVAADFFLPAVTLGAPSVPLASKIVEKGDIVDATVAKGLQAAQQLGKAGEVASGIVKNTQRISSATGTAAYRIPDILNHSAKVVGDVKNVSYLSYTSQLRDIAAYASQNGYSFELWVRPTTQLSGPLQQAVANGEIILRFLP